MTKKIFILSLSILIISVPILSFGSTRSDDTKMKRIQYSLNKLNYGGVNNFLSQASSAKEYKNYVAYKFDKLNSIVNVYQRENYVKFKIFEKEKKNTIV